jgi:MarR family transcriptional regulator, organic hydroperoxide resistance regulator
MYYVMHYISLMEQTDFITQQGLAFFAHRLRRTSELLTTTSGDWLKEQGFITPPRAVSTIQLLHREGPQAVTAIAAALRLSHPLILKLVERLAELGLASAAQDATDRRRRIVSLTAAGHSEAVRLALANEAMAASYAEILGTLGVDGLHMMQTIEADCRSGRFAERLRANMHDRENAE